MKKHETLSLNCGQILTFICFSTLHIYISALLLYGMDLLFQWHLGMFTEKYLPTLRGFESHYGYYQGCEDYFDHTYEANPVRNCDVTLFA